MIRQAAAGDLETLADLALLLWPGHARKALSEELSALLTREDAAFFLLSEGGAPAGFAQCGLRRDYVEGTHTSPVGYLEGIFVKASCRGRGYAAELLRACEAWAREKGCAEFASDCPAENEASRAFHVKSGFSEANRIICFTKKL
jgi:aminoglycoside N(6')-acetyltransferase type 1